MSIGAAEQIELQVDGEVAAGGGLGRDAWYRLKRNPSFWMGATLLALFVLMALLAPLIAPHGPGDRVGNLASVPPGPSREFWFGLDEQGRDLFSRIVYGSRLSLLVGIVSVGIGLAFGLVIGAVAGYLGGRVDGFLMRLMDLMLAIPGFLLAIGLVVLLGRGLFQIMFAIGITTVPIFARILRGSILAQRESDYVLAARAVGTPGSRILMVHIMPNAIAPVIVQATLAMATAIIDVAGLSFIGLGPNDPGLPEWGTILAQNAARLQNAAHLVFFAGFAVTLSVLAFNLVGDALREAIDPKLRA
jgi:ABC-type dipeptide/oligopeptide/nickel transport system permease subunit